MRKVPYGDSCQPAVGPAWRPVARSFNRWARDEYTIGAPGIASTFLAEVMPDFQALRDGQE